MRAKILALLTLVAAAAASHHPGQQAGQINPGSQNGPSKTERRQQQQEPPKQVESADGQLEPSNMIRRRDVDMTDEEVIFV